MALHFLLLGDPSQQRNGNSNIFMSVLIHPARDDVHGLVEEHLRDPQGILIIKFLFLDFGVLEILKLIIVVIIFIIS